jgi:hypothetical protein
MKYNNRSIASLGTLAAIGNVGGVPLTFVFAPVGVPLLALGGVALVAYFVTDAISYDLRFRVKELRAEIESARRDVDA